MCYKFKEEVFRRYLSENRPFFHITPTSNVLDILANGLRRGEHNIVGICTVIVNDAAINQHIIDTQLNTTGETDFTLFRILPQKFQLKISELCRDSTTELTNMLHLYINREVLHVDLDDIFDTIKLNREAIYDAAIITKKVEELRYQINVSAVHSVK